jgi:hypothetical protein
MKQKCLKYKAIIFTILSLLSIAQIANADENHLLAGTWSSKCASDDAGSFIIETFKFADKSASYSIKTYSD